MTQPILEVKDLRKWFPVEGGGLFSKQKRFVKAVDGVNLEIKEGETFGLVGESGSGKTTVGRCIIGLLTPTSGQILFRGQDITKLKDDSATRAGTKLGIVFQDPYASLDPRQIIKSALTEPMTYHKIAATEEEALAKAKRLIELVGLNEDHLYRFPHEFSGGQRQRIAVARALTTNPELIVLDEPTSFLDVSVQAQILHLLADLQKELKLTYLFISHNLSVIENMSDHVGVMYLGATMETADKKTIYRRPEHPYTHALISALPIPNPSLKKNHELLSGDIPSPVDIPSGCRFRTRCPYATDCCAQKEPLLTAREKGHEVSCHYELNLPSPLPAIEALSSS